MKTISMDFKTLIKRINYYPPYMGAGIKVIDYNEDFTRFEVEMKLTWYNRNLVGTQFGGSLYAMCDPFYMFILLANLGTDYIVWDKTGAIDFIKPGIGTVRAVFKISKATIQEIKNEVDLVGKKVFQFQTQVVDLEGNIVAKVEKGVYVRKKDFKK